MTRSTITACLVRLGAWKIRFLPLLLAISPGLAASQSAIGEMRRQAPRGELERAAQTLETAAMNQDAKTQKQLLADAQTIRTRLENGDFLPGDRILLVVLGDTALSDTFSVRGDRELPLPNIPPISLRGVLDSELEPHLTKELLKYLKQVSLQATPLVRISMVGFPTSNFYTFPVDQAITDVIATAGGWGGAAAHDKAVIRRNGLVLLDHKATADAVRMNKTLGDMGLRDGDELFVPDKPPTVTRWQTVTAVLAGVGSLYWIIRLLDGGGTRRVP